MTEDNPKTPPGRRVSPDPSGVTSLGMAELTRRVPKEHVRQYSEGAVIKDVGVDHPFAYVVSSGLVSIERDVMTPKGVQTITIEVLNQGDPFNEGTLFGISGSEDARNRYIAKTAVTLLEITTETLNARQGLEHVLWTFLRAKTRHDSSLRSSVEETIKTLLGKGVDPAAQESVGLLKRELASLKVRGLQDYQEIMRLKRELEEQKIESKLDGLNFDSLEVATLKEEMQTLTEQFRQSGAVKDERIKFLETRARVLEPIAKQKAQEAWRLLNESERTAKALVNLSNFVFELFRRNRVFPTVADVDLYREFLTKVHWQSSPEQFASLAEDLFDDDESPVTREYGPGMPREDVPPTKCHGSHAPVRGTSIRPTIPPSAGRYAMVPEQAKEKVGPESDLPDPFDDLDPALPDLDAEDVEELPSRRTMPFGIEPYLPKSKK
ncbi:hypothetical protein HY479_02765 [Candidatus Uhrbacteria bacterium]|nr:hypothetical protein [Candidatus Uhrbacteria bacterium]